LVVRAPSTITLGIDPISVYGTNRIEGAYSSSTPVATRKRDTML